MKTICGANCDECSFKSTCAGCAATGGRPFGGACVAAEYIKLGGRERYDEFKRALLEEVNSLLRQNGIPEAKALYELPGSCVNLAYPLPGGGEAHFLDSTKIYLGAQITMEAPASYCGVVADTTFILLSSYGENGKDPELLLYKKR